VARVLDEAHELGVLQLHLSGGEPLLRRDIVELAAAARDLGMYTNLVTSALGLSRRRAEELRAAGLDHVQVSIQADEPAISDRIAGTPSFARKVEACHLVKELGWPLTLNVVLHRQNIDRIAAVLRLAEELEADRVELANTQYYGWAWRNRDALLPSRSQLEQAEEVVSAARTRLKGRMDVIYVLPDYYSRYPKPCMGGWAQRQLTVAPNGDVLPCPAAQTLPLPRASVRPTPWPGSGRSRRSSRPSGAPTGCRIRAAAATGRRTDFGGCRCQAFLLTGDAARTDPVCHLSPDHGIVEAAVRAANDGPRELTLIPRPHRVGQPMTSESIIGLVVLAFALSLDNFRSSIALGTVPFGVGRAVQIALVFGFWDTVAPVGRRARSGATSATSSATSPSTSARADGAPTASTCSSGRSGTRSRRRSTTRGSRCSACRSR
jgi:pyrroloquinoline quinone biosynthesis protein E